MRLATFAIATAMTMAIAGVADAAQVTLNLTSGGTNAGSGYGNVRTFTSGSLTVTVTAWSTTGGSNTFQSAQLGQFSTGLGVCNRNEGTGCDSPLHQVDNVGAEDFVLFQFSSLVDPLRVVIDPVNNSPDFDRDVSYWTGTAANPLSLNGLGFGGLGALGFGSRIDNSADADDDARNVDLTSGLVNSLLFGANAVTDQDDWFKITSIKFDYTAPPPTSVPEPASLALLGVALAGLGIARRRRTA